MCLLRGTDWIFIYNSTFCPLSVIMCFVWIWEQTAIISLHSIDWPVCIRDRMCLLCGTDWIFIYNSTFCPHSVFMCFVWIWEQTAIISLYSINWLVFITETENVYCAVRTGSLYTIQVNLILYLAQDRDRWRAVVNAIMNLRVTLNARNFLTSWEPVSFSSRTLLRGVSEGVSK